jgi:hypothetical protein
LEPPGPSEKLDRALFLQSATGVRRDGRGTAAPPAGVVQSFGRRRGRMEVAWGEFFLIGGGAAAQGRFESSTNLCGRSGPSPLWSNPRWPSIAEASPRLVRKPRSCVGFIRHRQFSDDSSAVFKLADTEEKVEGRKGRLKVVTCPSISATRWGDLPFPSWRSRRWPSYAPFHCCPHRLMGPPSENMPLCVGRRWPRRRKARECRCRKARHSSA